MPLAVFGGLALFVGPRLLPDAGAWLPVAFGVSSLATTVLLGLWLIVVNAMMIGSYRLMLHKTLRRDAERRPGRRADGHRSAEPAASGAVGRYQGLVPDLLPPGR
jgi:hypothetical protein